MQVEVSLPAGSAGASADGRAEAALALVFGDGVRPLRMGEAVFDAALTGWLRQQSARHLAEETKQRGAQIVRRFRAETGLWPWQ